MKTQYQLELRKFVRGLYRVTLPNGLFAQLVKGRYYSRDDTFVRDVEKGQHWAIEVRVAKTGKLIRNLGVGTSRSECLHALADYIGVHLS